MRARPVSMLAAAACAAAAFTAPVASAAFGDLTQKPGEAGCIAAGSPFVEGCATATALVGAADVAPSPDAKHVYVAATGTSPDGPGAIAVFDRGPAGALTQKPGMAGCVAEGGAGGCTAATSMSRPGSVTVSPDGRNVYVVTATTIVVFDRDAATGALTQKARTAGCISEDGSGGACTDARSISPPGRVVVSPDNTSAYVSSGVPMSAIGSVAVFDRDPATGALTQKVGTAGCVSEDGSGGDCADGVALARASAIAVSPDAKSVYLVTHFNGVAIFDRAVATGALTQKPGAAGCITIFAADGCALRQGHPAAGRR